VGRWGTAIAATAVAAAVAAAAAAGLYTIILVFFVYNFKHIPVEFTRCIPCLNFSNYSMQNLLILMRKR
jgi:ABC-type multidrug transport system permease subunit